jgi:hypothetical protein
MPERERGKWDNRPLLKYSFSDKSFHKKNGTRHTPSPSQEGNELWSIPLLRQEGNELWPIPLLRQEGNELWPIPLLRGVRGV